jgi:hypothetical protein
MINYHDCEKCKNNSGFLCTYIRVDKFKRVIKEPLKIAVLGEPGKLQVTNCPRVKNGAN